MSVPNPPPPPPHPDFSRPPVPAPPAPPEPPPSPQPGVMHVTADQWLALQTEMSRLRESDAASRRAAEENEQKRLMALAEKGQIEQALTEQRSSWEKKHADAIAERSQIESAWFNETNSAAIARALAGREFVGEDPSATANLVRRLLEGEVETVRDQASGKPFTRSRSDYRPATDYLKERLDSPEFAVFFKPRTNGGAGTDGTRSQAPPKPPPAPLDPESTVKAWGASNGISGRGMAPAPRK